MIVMRYHLNTDCFEKWLVTKVYLTLLVFDATPDQHCWPNSCPPYHQPTYASSYFRLFYLLKVKTDDVLSKTKEKRAVAHPTERLIAVRDMFPPSLLAPIIAVGIIRGSLEKGSESM